MKKTACKKLVIKNGQSAILKRLTRNVNVRYKICNNM